MKLFFNKSKMDPNSNYYLSRNIKYNNKFYKHLAKDYDSFGSITNKIAHELESVCDFDNYFIGIHRTGYSCVTPEYLNDIFENGLYNNGHAMQGVKENYVDLEKTVSPISDFTLLVGVLKTGHNYKNSEGMFLVKIPKEYVSEKSEDKKPIYINDNGIPRLLPEYIYGYIPSDGKGNIKEIIRNKNYRDIHDYSNEGLLYEKDYKGTNHR